MSVLGAIRPDAWNFPLLLHVAGAMVLIGSASLGSIASFGSLRSPDDGFLRRLAFRSFLFVALPAYIVMRIGAEWLYSKEFGDSADDVAWIGVGYITADAGALLLLVTLIVSGLASRRGSRGLSRTAGIISLIIVIAWLIAVWAMGAKPG